MDSQRKQCCHIRKVLPLGRALHDRKAWITGLRREQSDARQTLQIQEWDKVRTDWLTIREIPAGLEAQVFN